MVKHQEASEHYEIDCRFKVYVFITRITFFKRKFVLFLIVDIVVVVAVVVVFVWFLIVQNHVL